MRKACYIDVETTGLNPWKNDIIQLAIIIEIKGRVVEEKEYKIRPINPDNINTEALRVHGMDKDTIMAFDPPQEIYTRLCNLLGKYVNKYDKKDKYTPIGYNVRFDVEFLKGFFSKMGDKYYGSWFNWRLVDPMYDINKMAYRGLIDYPDHKLSTVCKEIGIEIKAHDALSDIRATREILKILNDDYATERKSGL